MQSPIGDTGGHEATATGCRGVPIDQQARTGLSHKLQGGLGQIGATITLDARVTTFGQGESRQGGRLGVDLDDGRCRRANITHRIGSRYADCTHTLPQGHEIVVSKGVSPGTRAIGGDRPRHARGRIQIDQHSSTGLGRSRKHQIACSQFRSIDLVITSKGMDRGGLRRHRVYRQGDRAAGCQITRVVPGAGHKGMRSIRQCCGLVGPAAALQACRSDDDALVKDFYLGNTRGVCHLPFQKYGVVARGSAAGHRGRLPRIGAHG